jgi:hypothetical protein
LRSSSEFGCEARIGTVIEEGVVEGAEVGDAEERGAFEGARGASPIRLRDDESLAVARGTNEFGIWESVPFGHMKRLLSVYFDSGPVDGLR